MCVISYLSSSPCPWVTIIQLKEQGELINEIQPLFSDKESEVLGVHYNTIPVVDLYEVLLTM